MLIEISSSLWQNCLVDCPNSFERAFIDVQIWQMRQEIVSDENTHEDEVVDNSFQVVLERYLSRQRREFQIEVFSQERQVQEEKVGVGETEMSARILYARQTHPVLFLTLRPKVTSSRKRQK